jgi:hypothetical protein
VTNHIPKQFMKTTTSASLALIFSLTPSYAVILADFDGGGSYVEGSFRIAPVAAAQVEAGGPTGNFYHLLDGAEGSGGNYVGVSTGSSTANWTNATFKMDYRAENIQADGFSVAFVNVDTHGAGLVQAGSAGLADAEERGAYSDSIGVGFRTFNGTNATVNYNGVESADTAYPISDGIWGSLEISMDRNAITGDVLLDAVMYTGTNGSGTATSVFDDYAIGGVTMEEFRIQVAGRTGGSSMDLDIDNLELSVTGIPEPSSAILLGLAGLCLTVRRNRR